MSAFTVNRTAAPLLAVLAVTTFASPGDATADPRPYGTATCIQGLVWREARSGDTVCVTPTFRDRTAAENANPNANRDPSAGSGPLSCASGFVWREAFDGDTVCVTPAVRSENWAANDATESNYQKSNPGSDTTGGGTWAAIAISPANSAYGYGYNGKAKEDAEKMAMDQCFASGGTDCRVAVSAPTGCMALADSPTHWAGGRAPGQEEAEADALAANGGGKILVSGCTGA